MEEKFLLLIGKKVNLSLVNFYINRAKGSILKFTGLTEEELTVNLEDIIVDLAVYRYNITGVEHIKNESYNGNSFTYNLDIPDFIKTELKSYRKLRVY